MKLVHYMFFPSQVAQYTNVWLILVNLEFQKSHWFLKIKHIKRTKALDQTLKLSNLRDSMPNAFFIVLFSVVYKIHQEEGKKKKKKEY